MCLVYIFFLIVRRLPEIRVRLGGLEDRLVEVRAANVEEGEVCTGGAVRRKTRSGETGRGASSAGSDGAGVRRFRSVHRAYAIIYSVPQRTTTRRLATYHTARPTTWFTTYNSRLGSQRASIIMHKEIFARAVVKKAKECVDGQRVCEDKLVDLNGRAASPDEDAIAIAALFLVTMFAGQVAYHLWDLDEQRLLDKQHGIFFEYDFFRNVSYEYVLAEVFGLADFEKIVDDFVDLSFEFLNDSKHEDEPNMLIGSALEDASRRLGLLLRLGANGSLLGFSAKGSNDGTLNLIHKTLRDNNFAEVEFRAYEGEARE